MKKIFAISFLLIYMQSCKKLVDESYNGTIEFKLNGNYKKFYNSSDGKHSVNFSRQLPGQFNTKVQYEIFGNDRSNPSGEQSIIDIYIHTDTLKPITYNLDFNNSGVVLNSIKIDSAQYSVSYSMDQLTLTVTSITADRLSATFSGRMSPISGINTGSALITEGTINNVKIRD